MNGVRGNFKSFVDAIILLLWDSGAVADAV